MELEVGKFYHHEGKYEDWDIYVVSVEDNKITFHYYDYDYDQCEFFDTRVSTFFNTISSSIQEIVSADYIERINTLFKKRHKEMQKYILELQKDLENLKQQEQEVNNFLYNNGRQ